MLNDIRHYYERITSLFMDGITLACHQHELDKKPKSYKRKDFPLLHPGERAAYELLLLRNEWLEQERMQQSYIQERLLGLFV